MKTRGLLKTRRLSSVFFVLSFLMLFAGCQKDFDVHPDYNSQKKDVASYTYYDYTLNPSFLSTTRTGMPAVAINNNNQVVQVADNDQGGVSYQTGIEDPNGVISWNNAVNYDTQGNDPYVAINDNKTVVEINFVSGGFLGSGDHLIYHVGKLSDDNKTISFGQGQNFDHGVNPKIAINNNNIVIEVHKSQSNFGLWYHVGIVDPNSGTIAWGKGMNYDGAGVFPAIALNNNNKVIEVHQSSIGGNLYYRAGSVDPNTKTIKWGGCYKYQGGVTPDITLMDNNWFFEVHHTQKPLSGDLWTISGMINGTPPNTFMYLLGKSRKFSSGEAPIIAGNSNKRMVLSYDNGQGIIQGGKIIIAST